LEYLVVFALVANFSNDNDAVSRINASQKFCHEYLRFVDASQVCFPDHMCGPDIIYKCTSTKTVYIVQVKFVKGISKQEAVNACDTTDPERFYCKRKGNVVLKGFEQRRSQLRESLTQLQRDGYSLQQMLFIHTGRNQTLFTQGALVVTKSSHPSFSAWLGVVLGSSWILFGAVFSKTYQTISKDLVISEFIGKNFLVTS
jgi:hypothetical protein